MKKKICIIAQFPPPIHGLSKAVDTLYKSEVIQNEFEVSKVNITNNRIFLKNLFAIGNNKADLFYFTISQTKQGNIRDLIILKLLKLQHKKCVIHLHGGYYRQLVNKDMNNWQKNANYKVINKLDGAIVLGNSLKKIFQGMLSDDKIYVVPNCVDDEYLISDIEFEKKISTIDQRQVKHILYLSNFIPSKGYPEILKIAKLEKEQCANGKKKNFHFDFAGKFFERVEEDFFFAYIENNGLEKYVTYHGIVEGNKKRELLKHCDIFVLLTRYPNEGQPISILEAMGNGMAIITTDHAGIPDIVAREYGNIYESGIIDLPNTVYRDLCNLDIKNAAICARNEVKMKYTQEQYINKMQKVFRIIGGG